MPHPSAPSPTPRLPFSPAGRLDSFGNYFLVGLSGPILSDDDKRLLNTLKPLGVLLFKRNFVANSPYARWRSDLDQLLKEVHSYAEREKMIISIDHEGGDRFLNAPPPITRFPDAIRFAPYAVEVAKAMACELRSIGVNVSWAPVADINSNPLNPIIGPRAFGNSANSVIAAAVPFATTLAAEGILPCAKHFPGHGDTDVDPHFGLPVLHRTESQLFSLELEPFAALIQAQIPMIMTAHILFPQIDPHAPATFSHKILTQILRSRLGFNGVVVADNVEMAAVAKAFSDPATMTRSVKAGCDIFMISRHERSDWQAGLQYAHHLSQGLLRGEISEHDLALMHSRLEPLYDRLSPTTVSQLPENTWRQHAELAHAIRHEG